MVTATRPAPNLTRFRDIKARVNDVYEHQGDAIRAKPPKTLMTSGIIFEEMDWMVAEIRRLAGGAKACDDPERFERVRKFVARVCDEQSAAIKGGQFMKISAEIFGAMRFLVRALEKIIVDLVDSDLGDQITKDRMVDEHADRITLDLAEGITDPTDLEGDIVSPGTPAATPPSGGWPPVAPPPHTLSNTDAGRFVGAGMVGAPATNKVKKELDAPPG